MIVSHHQLSMYHISSTITLVNITASAISCAVALAAIQHLAQTCDITRLLIESPTQWMHATLCTILPMVTSSRGTIDLTYPAISWPSHYAFTC